MDINEFEDLRKLFVQKVAETNINEEQVSNLLIQAYYELQAINE